MKQFYKLVWLLILLIPAQASAQDIHFTQFYSSPVYLNPAFTGAGVCYRLSTTYRNQWPGVPNGYRSNLVSIDHHLRKQNVGLGLMIEHDVAGTGSLRKTVFNPLVAYEVRVSRTVTVRAGFKPGIGTVGVNFNDLTFGDQIARGGGVSTIENPVGSVTYFDFGGGVLVYSKKGWFGTSFYHLLSPIEGLVVNDDFSNVPLQFSAHGGYKIILNPEARKTKDQDAIFASFNYRAQREFDQLDLGFYLQKNVFTVGLWYRGLPGIKAYEPGYGNHDAVAVIVGLKTHRMNIGYSYDYTISQLTNASAGAHEITLSQQLCNPKRRRSRPKSWTPCPSF